jgi:hypothetical protein
VVRGQNGQPVGNYMVILLPVDAMDPAAASRWIHTARSDGNGRFQVRRVLPGRYVAAAVEYIEQGQQWAPEFQRLWRRGGRQFVVVEGKDLTLDLTPTPDI